MKQSLKETHSFATLFNLRRAYIRRAGDPPSLSFILENAKSIVSFSCIDFELAFKYKNLNYTFFVLSDVITRNSMTVLSEKKGESLLVIEFSIKEYKIDFEIDFELVFICINLNSIFFVLSDVNTCGSVTMLSEKKGELLSFILENAKSIVFISIDLGLVFNGILLPKLF